VHHHTIQINQPTRCNNLSRLLLDVYLQLNMFRTSSRPSSGAQQQQLQPREFGANLCLASIWKRNGNCGRSFRKVCSEWCVQNGWMSIPYNNHL